MLQIDAKYKLFKKGQTVVDLVRLAQPPLCSRGADYC
jgi:hypothetical protein